MGGVFAGAFGYADDLKLLTPSVWILYQMAIMYERYLKFYLIQRRVQ